MSQATRTVLVLSYYFPPDGGPGTQRTAKFCKYLGDFGWRPIVITRTAREERGRWDPEDATLLGDISQEATVIRVPETSGRDQWIIDATVAARRAIEEHQPEIAFMTMSPFELTEIGDTLLTETSVPVVYDLRDPWALDGWRLYSSKRQWNRDLDRMRQALSRASGIVANTPESKRAFLAAIPALESVPIAVINNGYDHEDFEQPVAPLESDRLWIVHTGTLHSHVLYAYRGLKGRLKRLRHHRPEPLETSGRTPRYLLEAIRLLRTQGHPLGDRVRVALVGLSDPSTERCVAESGVADCVRIEGYLTHRESVAWLQRAHALFLPLHSYSDGGEQRSLIVPGKVYEYLAAARPILACLPPGDALEIVEETGHAFHAPPCDPTGIAEALVRLHADVEARGIERTLPKSLQRYERRALTERLGTFLGEVVDSRRAAAVE